MSEPLPDLLQQVFSPDTFAKASAEWQRVLSHHMKVVSRGESAVLNWADPEERIREAESWMSGGGFSQDSGLVGGVSAILKKMLSSGQNLHHPHYIGHQVPASVPLAGLFDAVSSITNQVMAIYEMGPWATAVEHAVVRALCRKAGWSPDDSSGVLTHGGSLANLTALLTARNVALRDSWENGVPANAVLVTHSDSHYCVARSAGILGLGTKQVFKTAADAYGRIKPADLDALLIQLQAEGRTIMAVSACACSTPIGAFDPLEDIAGICRKHQVWLHVDAAHGGGLLMSRTHRHRLAGIEQADSVVWDAHKMLFVPALCAAVLYRNREHRFETFQQNAPYLFDPSAPGMADIDSGMRTVECTKRAAGFGLWGLWSLFGEEIFEQMVDRTIELARQFFDFLAEAGDFEPLHEPECNIVAFRYLPAAMQSAPPEEVDRFQRAVRTSLIRSGEFYIVQTTLHGRAALRVTVMNPTTTVDDLRELIRAIRRVRV